MNRYGYYPGCSAHSTAKEYDMSLKSVFAALGLALNELDDWNCCGASSAHNLSDALAVGLPARNLLIIEKSGLETVAPCAACYNRLRIAQEKLAASPERYGWLREAIGGLPQNGAVVRSPLDVLLQDVGLERIAKRVRRPLAGLKTVSYYGCLLARPASISELSDTEHPQELDLLMRALQATPLSWSYAVDCCGGALSISRSDIARRMTQRIVDAAVAAGATLIVTACPLCQANIEMRQSGQARLPALYFTEAMGMAFDLPESGQWWKKHLVDPRPALRRLEMV